MCLIDGLTHFCYVGCVNNKEEKMVNVDTNFIYEKMKNSEVAGSAVIEATRSFTPSQVNILKGMSRFVDVTAQLSYKSYGESDVSLILMAGSESLRIPIIMHKFKGDLSLPKGYESPSINGDNISYEAAWYILRRAMQVIGEERACALGIVPTEEDMYHKTVAVRGAGTPDLYFELGWLTACDVIKKALLMPELESSGELTLSDTDGTPGISLSGKVVYPSNLIHYQGVNLRELILQFFTTHESEIRDTSDFNVAKGVLKSEKLDTEDILIINDVIEQAIEAKPELALDSDFAMVYYAINKATWGFTDKCMEVVPLPECAPDISSTIYMFHDVLNLVP